MRYLKAQLEEDTKKKKELRDFRINQYINSYTKEQLEKKLEKLEMESEKIYKWWTTRRRLDEKTMRKANYFNKAEGIAKEMKTMEVKN